MQITICFVLGCRSVVETVRQMPCGRDGEYSISPNGRACGNNAII